MKKIFILSLVFSFVVIACNRKSVATKEPVIPQREASITPNISNNNPSPVVTTTEVTGEAAIAAGKTIYQAKCGRCHNLKNVGAYDERSWVGILKIMTPRAKLTETETQQVTAYVKANAKK